jgi:hypothetical protein
LPEAIQEFRFPSSRPKTVVCGGDSFMDEELC